VGFRVPRFAGRTVLVVEDELDSREMMSQMLEALGVHVVLAEDACRALEAVTREVPDLILCDLRMATLDGFGLIRRLREDPRLSGKPIVAVTALGSASDYQRTWEAGFDGHFVKPVDFDAVAELLGRYLADRPLRPRAA
jgi:two-component system, cell cycle response regulator